MVPDPAVVPVRIRTVTADADEPAVKETTPEIKTPDATASAPSMPVIWQTTVSDAADGDATIAELEYARADWSRSWFERVNGVGAMQG